MEDHLAANCLDPVSIFSQPQSTFDFCLIVLPLNKDLEMRTTWFALSLCLSLASGSAARVALADPLPASVWKLDFAAAEAEAKALNRPMVVHFYGTHCPPCKKMEQEVLLTPQVLKLLEAGFVAVKVDVVKNPNVSQRYGIASMPTDLILSPDGKVLAKTEGYDDIARVGDDRDRRKYVANLTRINGQYAGAAKRQEQPKIADTKKSTEQREPRTPAKTAPVKTDRALASAALSTKDKLVPPANRIDPPVGSQSGGSQPVGSQSGGSQTDEPPKIDESQETPAGIVMDDVLVAMDGYCPVTLRTTRSWKAGDKAISLEHEGQIYYFVTADKRDEFKSHPSRYAPRLLGCDPVTLADNDVAIRGSTQFGAFYDGALFLFESADSRAKFRKAPTRYSQLKHVLKPEDVKNVASNVDP